jgi:hypothetical protein
VVVQSAQRREGFCIFGILMEPGRVQCLSQSTLTKVWGTLEGLL